MGETLAKTAFSLKLQFKYTVFSVNKFIKMPSKLFPITRYSDNYSPICVTIRSL